MKLLTAFWYRLVDLVKSAGSPPYEYYNSQGLGHSSTYRLNFALTAGDTLEGTKSGKIPIWINGQKYTFRFDKLGRRRLPVALRKRLLR